jgi:UPF0755 protein
MPSKLLIFWERYKIACAGIIFLILTGLTLVIISSTAPSNFPNDATVTIPKNIGMSETADILKSQGIIRSTFLFKVYSTLLGGRGHMLAGDYLFIQPQSAIKVAERIITGTQGLSRVKVTITEGLDVKEISKTLTKSIPDFASSTFVTLATPKEGYLFPNTYFFYVNVKPEEVINTMSTEFNNQIRSIQPDISSFVAASSTKKFPITEDNIITLASIVEKEATLMADRKIVAGILWKRLMLGMALQVDPPFHYFLGKDLSQLTTDDLKKDSPYNLYLHTGLPPTPIDSPSLEAIQATIAPTTTKYLFYLSGTDGTMHYATTFDGHIANRQQYLK